MQTRCRQDYTIMMINPKVINHDKQIQGPPQKASKTHASRSGAREAHHTRFALFLLIDFVILDFTVIRGGYLSRRIVYAEPVGGSATACGETARIFSFHRQVHVLQQRVELAPRHKPAMACGRGKLQKLPLRPGRL